jgi:hypothetical protein
MTEQQVLNRSSMSETIHKGKIDAFKELYKSNPELRHARPWVFNAACDGQPEAVTFLLQQGHSPDERSQDSTQTSALCAACSEGHVDCARVLIQAGASIQAASIDDNPLISAIPKDSLECVKLLVDAGVDIHKSYKLEDGRLRNALEFAERWGCKDIAEFLRSKGAMLPGEKSGKETSPSDQFVLKLQDWFQASTPKSAGSIGLGKNFGQAELRWFDMSSMDHPFLTLFTLGLSEHLLATPAFGTVEARVELMMHLPFTWPMDGEYAQDPQFQWPLNWIRTLPQHILSGSIPLPGTHVIISNDQPPVPLGPGTEQTCLLLIADFYQCFPIETSEGQKIHFYHVVPLYTEERDFEKANGMQPLLEAMAAKGLESLVVRPDRERFVN